jgi:hypothetical protein
MMRERLDMCRRVSLRSFDVGDANDNNVINISWLGKYHAIPASSRFVRSGLVLYTR